LNLTPQYFNPRCVWVTVHSIADSYTCIAELAEEALLFQRDYYYFFNQSKNFTDRATPSVQDCFSLLSMSTLVPYAKACYPEYVPGMLQINMLEAANSIYSNVWSYIK